MLGHLGALSDLRKRPPIAFERGFLAGQLLPALNDDVDVFRIEFHSVTDAFGQLRSRERRAAAQKRS